MLITNEMKELGKPCEEFSVEIVCNKTNPEVTQYASNYYMLKRMN
jgi:hypothetical protein